MKKTRGLIKIRRGRLNLGIALILIGLLWILSNFNIIDINLYNILSNLIRGLFDLWPLILIIIGISFIFKKEILNTILWAGFIAVLLIYSFFVKDTITLRNSSDSVFKEEEIEFQMEEGIEKGKLYLDIGAAKFKVDSADFELVKLRQDGDFNYSVTSKGFVEEVYIENKVNFDWINTRKERDLFLSLNKGIPWEMDLDVGAVSGDLDLKDIMIDHISIDMGAGDLEFTMGDKNDFTSIDIDAGASNIVLNLPRDIGLKVQLDGGLNSINLDTLDLIEPEKNKFESKNYGDSTSKYEIDVDMGVGNFKVNYY